MQAMMARLTDDENMPIESKMITRTVESSQKKVEGRNFGIRKQTLQYDDVMNRQRQLIYQQRDQVLDGIDLTDKILQMLDTNIEENVKNYFAGDHKSDWNVAGLKEKYKGWLTTEDDFNDDVNMLSVQGTIDMLQERGHKRLEEKRELLGDEMFQDFERMVLCATSTSFGWTTLTLWTTLNKVFIFVLTLSRTLLLHSVWNHTICLTK